MGICSTMLGYNLVLILWLLRVALRLLRECLDLDVKTQSGCCHTEAAVPEGQGRR